MNLRILLFAILCASIPAGCAALWDPAVHGVSVETHAPDRVRVTDVTLYRLDKGLLLTGKVGVRSLATSLKGYVEVQVVAPDGSVVMTRRPDHYPHSEMHDETDQLYGFSLELPILPEKGDRIRVTYHAGDAGKQPPDADPGR